RIRGLHQRRVGRLRPALVAGQSHNRRWLADHQGFSEPASLDREGGRRHNHPLGRRFHEHEFKALTTYGKIDGANLLDWPITLADLEPYYAKAEDKMGVTRTNDIAGLPGNNNFKVFKAGAD